MILLISRKINFLNGWGAAGKYVNQNAFRILSTIPSCPNQSYVAKRFQTTSASSPPPLPPPRKSRRIISKLLFLMFATTAAIAGGLYTCPYLRDGLIHYFPDTDPILKQTEEFVGGWYTSNPKQIQQPLESTSLPFLSQDEETPEHDTPPDQSTTVSSEVLHLKDEPESETLPTIDDVVQMTKERARVQLKSKTTLDLTEVTSEASQSVQAATRCLANLECSSREHIEALRDALRGAATSKDKEKKWDKAAKLATLAEKAQAHASEATNEARHKLDSLREAIADYRSTEAAFESDLVPDSIKAHMDLQYTLSGAINEVRKLQSEATMLKRYRDLEAAAHESLREDLSSLRDQVDLERISKEAASLSVDDLIDLVNTAHSRIIALQSKLASSEEKKKSRLRSAMEAQRQADEQLTPEYVKRELERQQDLHELDCYHRELQVRENAKRESRAERDRYSDYLGHMLRRQDEDKERQFSLRLREERAQQKTAFEAALAGWTRRMQAIEDVVDGRAELDRIAKESQALWIACEALASMLTTVPSTGGGQPHEFHDAMRQGTDWTGSLAHFVEAIKEVAQSGNHPFALEVLDRMSVDVVTSGVWLERGLARRFDKVYKVCRRVALVDETGGSLWTYAISWLQSFLMLDAFQHRYHHHLEKLPWYNPAGASPSAVVSYDCLLLADSEVDSQQPPDTFCLLRSAKAAMTADRCSPPCPEDDGHGCQGGGGVGGDKSITGGDEGIELAVRLLGQLRGQARAVADDWLRDARRYLEARQTAKALLAYASARNMSSYQKRL